MGKDLNRHLIKDQRYMANKHMRRCSKSYTIRELQIKIIMRYYYILFGEGNGNPLQYSRLENPMDGGAWWAIVYRVAKSWT